MWRSLFASRWSVVLFIIGLAGCAKAGLPRAQRQVAAIPNTPSSIIEGQRSDSARGQNSSGQLDRLSKLLQCEESHALIRKLAPTLKLSPSQYHPLRALAQKMSPFLTPGKIEAAHRTALEISEGVLQKALVDKKQESVWNDLRIKLQASVNYKDADADLHHALTAIQFPEEHACAQVFLYDFYQYFVQGLDRFGSVKFGALGLEDLGYKDPFLILAGLGVTKPGKPAPSLPLVSDVQSTKRITIARLPRWELNEGLEAFAQQLEEKFRLGQIETLILDLASAAGYDEGVLRRMRESAQKGWGELPQIVIWFDDHTRGTPEVFLSELAARPNVTTVSAFSRSEGYARKFCTERDVQLADPQLGLATLTLTLSCELLETSAGQSPDGVGVAPSYPLASGSRLSDVVKLAESLGR